MWLTSIEGSLLRSLGAKPLEATYTAATCALSGSTRTNIGMAIRSKNHDLPEIYEYPDIPSRQAVPADSSTLVDGIVIDIYRECSTNSLPTHAGVF